jgi:hypothetical protein
VLDGLRMAQDVVSGQGFRYRGVRTRKEATPAPRLLMVLPYPGVDRRDSEWKGVAKAQRGEARNLENGGYIR